MLEQVGVREFKNGASHYIDRAEAGAVLTITRRGRPVARVIPAGMPSEIAQLLSDGKARWNGRRPELPEAIALRGDGPLASDYVAEGRR
jgi:prevent-host-death family protein